MKKNVLAKELLKERVLLRDFMSFLVLPQVDLLLSSSASLVPVLRLSPVSILRLPPASFIDSLLSYLIPSPTLPFPLA